MLDKFRIADTADVAEMVDGITARNPHFINLKANSSPDWKYTFNRLDLGSVRLGVSRATHVIYQSVESSDITITGCFSGVEQMKRGRENRAINYLPCFSPKMPVHGVVRDAHFYTVRLKQRKLLEFIAEFECDINPDEFIEAHWLKVLPKSASLASFLNYTFNYIDTFGAPSSSEARALEDLIYANAARTMIIEEFRPSASGNARAFARCAEYIDKNLASDISIKDIANVAGLSLRSVQNLFQQMCNTTITAYIREQRLLRARKLLEGSEKLQSVLEVALASGFNHPSYFSQLYRARFGEAPSKTLRRY